MIARRTEVELGGCAPEDPQCHIGLPFLVMDEGGAYEYYPLEEAALAAGGRTPDPFKEFMALPIALGVEQNPGLAVEGFALGNWLDPVKVAVGFDHGDGSNDLQE